MTNRGSISVGIGAVVGLALGAAPRAVFTEGTGVTFLPALIGLAVGAYLGWAADRRGRALAVAIAVALTVSLAVALLWTFGGRTVTIRT